MNLFRMPAHHGAICPQSVRELSASGADIPLRKPNANPTGTQTMKDAFERLYNGCSSVDEAVNARSRK
jgi:hypothetical protein